MVVLLGLLPLAAIVVASELRLGSSVGPGAQATIVPTTAVSVAAPPVSTVTTGPTALATSAPAVGAPTVVPTSLPTVTAAATTTTAATPTTTSAATPTAGVTQNTGATASVSGPFRAYRVQAGDTLRSIAGMYGVSIASVAQASGLRNPDQLRVGQVLTIPIQPGWLYRVQPGETLDQIAARTGVPADLVEAASQKSNADVSPGEVILIPDMTVATAKGK